MTVNYTTLLALGQPVTGTESGTWRDDVNNAVTSYLDIASAGTLTFTGDGAITLANTQGTNSATNIGSTSAQYAVLRFNGTLTLTKVVTAPSTSKIYLVDNATSGGFGVTIKASGQTGYTVSAGTKAWVYFNGTDYVLVDTNDITKLTGTLPVANGGTNATATPTAGAVAYGTGTAYAFTSAGTAGQVLQSNGAGAPTWANAATGTVTAVSVSTANGFAGTSSGGATPALTLTTSVTGLLKGNGTAMSAATAGTDYVAPGTATTFTATQTFSGSSSVLGAIFNDAAEVATVSATAATGTINYDVTTQSVIYYTTNASANWTVNFRGSSGTSLDTLMSTGQSLTVAFLVTQGATAYYNSAVQVDGASVTPKYQGGTAWSAGNASGVDAYVYTIVKTGSATFTVFASQTQFK